MPVYAICPHCQHPMVVPGAARGKGRLCKQCGQGYRVSKYSAAAQPLPVRSAGDLFRLSQAAHRPAVYVMS